MTRPAPSPTGEPGNVKKDNNMTTQQQLDDAITGLESSVTANKAVVNEVLALFQSMEKKLAGVPGLDLESELARISAIKAALDAAGVEGQQIVDSAPVAVA